MAEGDLNDLSSLKELRELVEFLKASGVTQFDMERPEMKVRLKFSGPEIAPPAGISGADLANLSRMFQGGAALAPGAPDPEPHPSMPAVAEVASAVPVFEIANAEAGLHIVKSPLVGTFYDAPSPGATAFAKVGDRVELGKVLCIVEAMKIMNEIESDAAGEIVALYAKPGQPVEYGQKLFGVRP